MTTISPTMPATMRDLLRTDITTELQPSTVLTILSSPPFLLLSSAMNMRDLGLVTSSPIKTGLVFTSGMLSYMSPTDLASLSQNYHVKRVYDLRSSEERSRAPEPTIEGVQTIWIDGVPRISQMETLAQYAVDGGVPGMVAGYKNVLEKLTGVYGRVVRDLIEDANGDGAILFHCTGSLFLTVYSCGMRSSVYFGTLADR
jgi:hypothetical protein